MTIVRQSKMLPVFVIAILIGLPVLADDSAQSIRDLIKKLDADQFSVRQSSHLQLLKLGEAALPHLAQATNSKSTEQRYRIGQLIREIRRRALVAGFTKLANQPDEKISIEEGMWLITRIIDYSADRSETEAKIKEIADAVRTRLGKEVDPAKAPPQKAVEAIIHVLSVDYGFAGNRDDYDNPDNSSLRHVLAKRKGLPILLSHVAIAVADRLQVPLVGLQVPGRYMIKYNGAAAPEGQPKDDIIIDPYGDWKILTPGEVKTVIPSFDPATHLVPTKRRAALMRMLRNLISDFYDVGKTDLAKESEYYLLLLQTVAPENLEQD